MFVRGQRTKHEEQAENQELGTKSRIPVFRFSLLASRFSALDDWFSARAVWMLVFGVTFYVVAFTAAAWYKYHTYGMGFDLAAHEQVLWNTAHGRIAASSPHNGTSSYFGIDIIITELLFAPLYALVPSAYTILSLQALVVGLGALPVYWIARDRLESSFAGLAFAAVYLLYAPVEWMTLYEFQIRAFATTFLLCALYALHRRRPLLFLLWSTLALGCRSDVGLVVAGMGVYAMYDLRLTIDDLLHAKAVHRKSQVVFVFLPILVGLGWLLLCTLVLVPWFREGDQSLYIGVIFGELAQRCGKLPFGALMHPVCVAQYVFAPGDGRGVLRLHYLLEMFLPFAFLPLLSPRALLPSLPIFAINLLSNTPNIHASTHYHYQALIIPFMLIAAIEGLARVTDGGSRTKDERNDEGRRTKDEGQTRSVRLSSFTFRPSSGALALLVLALACNLGFRNPFFSLLTQRVNHAHNAVAERLIARIPPGVSVAASNLLGAHLANRQQLYVFPGDDIIYPVAYFWRADYLLVDSSKFDPRSHDADHFAAMRASGQYGLLDEEDGISLWRRGGTK